MSKFESSKNFLTATLFSLALPHCAANQAESKAAPLAPAQLMEQAIEQNDEDLAKMALVRTMDPKAAVFGFQPDGSIFECQVTANSHNFELPKNQIENNARKKLAEILNRPEIRQFIQTTDVGRTIETGVDVKIEDISAGAHPAPVTLKNGKMIWCAKAYKSQK